MNECLASLNVCDLKLLQLVNDYSRAYNLFDQVDFAANKQTHSNDSPHGCIHSLTAKHQTIISLQLITNM